MMPLLFEQSLQQLRLGELETGRLERKAESWGLWRLGEGETWRAGWFWAGDVLVASQLSPSPLLSGRGDAVVPPEKNPSIATASPGGVVRKKGRSGEFDC